MFAALSHKLEPLVKYRPKLLKCERLQHVCDLLKDHPTWNSAHLAAKLALLDFLSKATMAEYVLSVSQNLTLLINIKSQH